MTVVEESEHWFRPTVTPVAPATGWRRASSARRTFAIAAFPLVTAWTALAVVMPMPLWTAAGGIGGCLAWIVYLVLGPICCYATARILRPHCRPQGERLLRHLLAATATAYGLPLSALCAYDVYLGELVLVTFEPIDPADGGAEPSDGAVAYFFAVLGTMGLSAVGLGLITGAWGLLAFVVRAVTARSTPDAP